jgi:outer membrane immunogenic protein
LAGFFWGAQKQYGNWVLGFDADIEGADIKGTSTSNVRTSNAVFVPPNFEDDITQLNHSAALEAKIDLLGRFVGKIGWAWSPNWMIYGTGGMAYAHVKDSLADVQNVVFGTLCDVPDGTTDPNQCDHVRSATNSIIASANQSMFGWTIGAGIDYKWQIDPGSAVVLGVDYRFYDFPTQTFTFSDPNTGFSTGFSSKQTINVVQARISYLFSIH